MANDASRLSSYAGLGKDLIMHHGIGSIGTKVSFCKLQTPATFPNPIQFNQKDQTTDTARYLLPSFLPADLQTACFGLYRHGVVSNFFDKISIETSGTDVYLVVKVTTMAHGNYPFTYQAYY